MLSDRAVSVEIGLIVEWRESAVVDRPWSSRPAVVVDHDVDHEIHVSSMYCGRQSLQIVDSPKIWVQSPYVLLPVAVVSLTVASVLR